jgi:DNA-binding transcriptional regulator YiaG
MSSIKRKHQIEESQRKYATRLKDRIQKLDELLTEEAQFRAEYAQTMNPQTFNSLSEIARSLAESNEEQKEVLRAINNTFEPLTQNSQVEATYSFGWLLQALRHKNKNVTQESLAKTLGISIITYRNWETDMAIPDEERLKKLIEELYQNKCISSRDEANVLWRLGDTGKYIDEHWLDNLFNQNYSE